MSTGHEIFCRILETQEKIKELATALMTIRKDRDFSEIDIAKDSRVSVRLLYEEYQNAQDELELLQNNEYQQIV